MAITEAENPQRARSHCEGYRITRRSALPSNILLLTYFINLLLDYIHTTSTILVPLLLLNVLHMPALSSHNFACRP